MKWPPELERALAMYPDEPAGYAVLADWLGSQGHRLGELIAIDLAAEATGADELYARSARLREELLRASGALFASPYAWKSEVTWRWGLVYALSLGTSYQGGEAATCVAELPEMPLTRFMRELTLQLGTTRHGAGPIDDELPLALARGVPPLLRRLVLTHGSASISWSHLGNLEPSYAALCNLEELTIEAGRFDLGQSLLPLPSLRQLRLVCGGLRRTVLSSLTLASWPKLETLEVFFGDERYGRDCSVADVRQWLERSTLPLVRTLGVCNAEFADELPELLSRSRVLRQLRRLSLAHGTLGPEGVARLLARREAFAHLDELDLRDNFIRERDFEALRTVCRSVRLESQKPEPAWGRYVSIAE